MIAYLNIQQIRMVEMGRVDGLVGSLHSSLNMIESSKPLMHKNILVVPLDTVSQNLIFNKTGISDEQPQRLNEAIHQYKNKLKQPVI